MTKQDRDPVTDPRHGNWVEYATDTPAGGGRTPPRQTCRLVTWKAWCRSVSATVTHKGGRQLADAV